MQLFTRPGLKAAVYATLLLGISGCRSSGTAISKDREIEELRYENERRRESIIAGLAEAERMRRGLSDLEAERTTLLKQVSDLGTSLRAATTELASTTTQRDDLRVKLADAERSSERLQQSMEKIRAVAGASAGELAELRLRNQELDESVRKFTERQGALADENRKLGREVEDLREELVRTRAVLRSIREGAPDKAGIAALEEQLAVLERKNADLEGEKIALQKRIEALGVTAGASPEGVAAAGEPGSSRSASSILWELGGIIEERYQGALEGKFRWDSLDLILAGAIAVVLLFLYWVAIRWLRTRRLKKQVRALTARVHDLEQGGSGPRGSVREAAVEAGGLRAEGSSRIRKSPTVRRSGFAAVITNKEVQGKPAGQRPAEITREEPRRIERAAPIVAEGERVLQGVLHGTRETEPPAAREKGEPRKVIGARLWSEEAASQDDLASTQIISKGIEERAADPLPPVAAKAAPKAAPKADPLRGTGRPAKDEASEGDDIELLQELKAVINKKFDELMK
jgi:hypothetical protein